jgi:hypothetical protein
MTFPRICAAILGAAGTFWVLLPLWSVVGLLLEGVGLTVAVRAALLYLLVMGPGLVAWYGYIRRAFGRFLFGSALFTWSISIVANCWSLGLLYIMGGNSAFYYFSVSWSAVVLILSVICLVRDSADGVPANKTGDNNAQEAE